MRQPQKQKKTALSSDKIPSEALDKTPGEIIAPPSTEGASLPPLPTSPSEGPEVCYLDSDLIIIDKPHWLLSVPGRLPENKDSAVTRLEKKWGEVFVVHRLDCATRGLMMFARNKAAQSNLSKQFQNRQIEKIYHAQVVGVPKEETGEINLPLITDWPNRPKQKVDFETGKPSCTQWRLLKAHGKTSTLELKPITGRSHQLRLHLSAIGHPILGDRLYAPKEWVFPYPKMKLEAIYLGFIHPKTQERRGQALNNTAKSLGTSPALVR